MVEMTWKEIYEMTDILNCEVFKTKFQVRFQLHRLFF